ncbi:hypothetical protein BST81_13475 [Leptolyngbya sp. 'hensonii']|nr:hypothetical protein BST81_13475 [Leptolyngbya sp. 'hensonii']
MESIAREIVLIVDDIPENLNLLHLALERKGYEVCIATSGAMALMGIEVILPDLILLDILMPQMDGYEVCERLKANPLTRHIPIIFVSALDEVSDKVKAFNLGVADYITKPFQLEETLARIEHQLRLRSLQRQLEEKNLRLQQEIQERKQVEQSLERLTFDLERQVKARTAQLELAYNFEATLKRITDRVRDSLDENQILQTAVQELAQAIGSDRCDAALYDLNQQTSTIRYEHTNLPGQFQGRRLQMSNAPEVYRQLLQGQSFQFCPAYPLPEEAAGAILVCPILKDVVVLGDLWLTNQVGHSFSEQDIRLVQQVANQCAIALRQAQLYQAAQTQVEALERLNRLKDDFLSTISHELRTPISNIKLVSSLLALVINQEQPLGEDLVIAKGKQAQLLKYVRILQEECDRELRLIQDILDLQHLEAGVFPLNPTLLDLNDYIPHLLEPFEIRFQAQEQTLEVALSSELPQLTVDPSSFKRILTELVNNACKYTPPGGRITVAARVVQTINLIDGAQPTEPPPASSELARSVTPPMLHLTVRNTGVEIPSEELSRIFDKFYRIPNNDPWRHGGTGLGLTLIKRLVEHLGGEVRVTSDQNATCFVVVLPISELENLLLDASPDDSGLNLV